MGMGTNELASGKYRMSYRSPCPDHTRGPGGHNRIYSQPPAETDNEWAATETVRSSQFSTKLSAQFTRPKKPICNFSTELNASQSRQSGRYFRNHVHDNET